MINPAFIVDGQMEKMIIEDICPGKPVRLLNCNGRDVSMEAAGKKVASLIRLMKRNHPIIILFDREKRHESSQDICKKLYEEIIRNSIPDVELHIGVPDRMMENWMLADVLSVNDYYGKKIRQSNYEGVGGKAKIKEIALPNTYHETEDGPEIAKRVRSSVALQNSPSYKNFYDKVKDISCSFFSK